MSGEQGSKGNEPPQDQSQLQTKVVALADRFGNKFYVGNAGDLWVPPFPLAADVDYRDIVRKTRDMEVRDGDVLICSYPKTGTHWSSFIIDMLMRKSTTHVEKSYGLLEMGVVLKADQLPSPRQLNTHLPFRHVPKQAFDKKIKIVLLLRNPKDVLVSFYHHSKSLEGNLGWSGSFEHFFRYEMEVGGYYGHMLDYMMDWQDGLEAHPDVKVHFVVFEDLKADPVGSVMKLNDYLETGCSKELCEEISKACGFNTLKKAREELMPEFVKGLFKDRTPTFYRKGDVGDWKNHFTVAMNEQFDAEYKRRMSNYKTSFKYTL